MPSIAEPSRARLDVLLFMDMADLDRACEEHPDLADLRCYSEARNLEGAHIRNAYVTRLAFNNWVNPRHYRLWYTLDQCQLNAGLNGKIIIL